MDKRAIKKYIFVAIVAAFFVVSMLVFVNFSKNEDTSEKNQKVENCTSNQTAENKNGDSNSQNNEENVNEIEDESQALSDGQDSNYIPNGNPSVNDNDEDVSLNDNTIPDNNAQQIVIENKPQDTSKNITLTINTSQLEYDNEDKIYVVNNALSYLDGTLEGVNDVQSMQYEITNFKGMVVKSGTINPQSSWTAENIGLVLGKNTITVNAVSNDTECKAYINILNYSEENMYNADVDLSDMDGDGLENYVEAIYGCNPNSTDTDGDGLSDYVELYDIGTDPTVSDTDGNGIDDGYEDTDGDGLINIDEIRAGTVIYAKDSDGDLLSDYEEICLYGTSPLLTDTDGDGAEDSWEINHSYNPLVAEESFVINEIVYGDMNNVEINVEVTGKQTGTFKAKALENDKLINDTILGYIGNAFDFSLDGTFISAEVKFTFEEEFLNIEGFNPVIYYVNEEQECLEEIETVWDGHSSYVTATLEHFSKYILLNKTEFDKIWEENYKPDIQDFSNVEIVFVLDVSGSMRGSKMTTLKNAIYNFTDVVDDNNTKLGIVTFSDTSKKIMDLTSDKQAIKNAVRNIGANGFTAIYKGMENGVSLFSDDDSTYRLMIVVTDGFDEPVVSFDKVYEPILTQISEKNIKVDTIGISTIDENKLKSISERTGGTYYFAQYINEISKNISNIKKENEELKSDSNNDKLSDYHTRLICDGKILYWTGARVVKCTSYESINKNNDYDGDGIINGEEIEVIEGSNGRIYVKEYSDMTLIDSDDDGIDDYDEMMKYTDPLIKDIKIGDMNYLLNNDLYNSSILSEDYLNDNWLHFQIVAGNALLNNNFVYVSDYKLAITNFLTIYLYDLTEQETERLTKNALMDKYESDYEMLTDMGVELISVGAEMIGEYDEYNECIDTFYKSLYGTEASYQKMKNAQRIAEFEGFAEFGDLYHNTYTNELVNNKIIVEKMPDLLKKYPLGETKTVFSYLPEKIQSLIKKTDKKLEYFGVIVHSMKDVVDVAEIYAEMEYLVQSNELFEEFFLFASMSRNTEIRLALYEIEAQINDKSCNWSDMVYDIFERCSENAIDASVTTLKMALKSYGFAIDTGMFIGDFLFNTGELCKKSLNDIVYGDLSVAMTCLLNRDFTTDGEFYYLIGAKDIKRIQLLSQLRIMGEKSFKELYSSKSDLVKAFDSLLGYSESDVNKAINNRINCISQICNILNINVYIYEYGRGTF